MRLPENVKISEKVPSEKKQGVSSDNASICPIIPASETDGCNSGTQQQRITKLSTQSAMGL